MNIKQKILNKKYLNAIIQSCLIFLVIFTPLALGTVQPWSIFIMRIAVIIALISWLIKILTHQTYGTNIEHKTLNIERKTYFHHTPLTIPLLMYLSVAIVSTIISSYKWISLSLLANLFVYIAIYFLIVNNLKTEADIKRLLTAILCTSLILGIYGLLQYSNILELTPRVTNERICSAYYNSNHYAGYLAMITPIPIALFLFLPWGKSTIPLILLSILLIVNLALSYSWGSIGFGVGVIFLIFTRIWLSKRKELVITIGALVLISFAILGVVSMLSRTPKLPENTLSARYTHMVNFASISMGTRLFMYKNTIPLILDHPYLGTGIGMFRYAFTPYRPPQRTNFWWYAHNDYLQIASEIGLIGLAVFLFLVIIVLIKGFKALKLASNFNRAIILGVLAGILSILVHGLFDANLSVIPANILHFYTIMGLLVSTTLYSKPRNIRQNLGKA